MRAHKDWKVVRRAPACNREVKHHKLNSTHTKRTCTSVRTHTQTHTHMHTHLVGGQLLQYVGKCAMRRAFAVHIICCQGQRLHHTQDLAQDDVALFVQVAFHRLVRKSVCVFLRVCVGICVCMCVYMCVWGGGGGV